MISNVHSPGNRVEFSEPLEKSSETFKFGTGEETLSTTSDIMAEWVHTEWVTVVFIPKVVVSADFEEPRSIEDLANEHRRFLAGIQEPLEDVDLPFDN